MSEIAESGQTGGRDVSTYAPVKPKFQRLIEKRTLLENGLLAITMADYRQREQLIEAARQLFEEANTIFTVDERDEIGRILATIIFKNKEIFRFESTPDYNARLAAQRDLLPREYENFKNYFHSFLQKMADAMYDANIDGFSSTQEKDTTGRLFMAMDTKPRWKNAIGIWVSPEMVSFCLGLHCRAMNGYDNIVTIKGPRGIGKTRFTIAMLSTYSTLFTRLGWDWNRNLVINEDRAFVEKLLMSFQPLDCLQLDEAGNQTNRKLWYQLDQIGFINYITRLRVHGLTIAAIWPDTDELDPTLAKKYAVINVEIQERGTAIVRGFNHNPYAKREYIPYGAKNRVALSGQDAANLIDKFDMLKIMDIPFFDISEKVMAQYEARKEISLKVSAIGKVKKGGNVANTFYIKFFLMLNPLQEVISLRDVQEFGRKEGYKISLYRVAQILGRATGRKTNQIISIKEGATGLDFDKDGIIRMDEYIGSYLERVASMHKGSLDTKELEDKTTEL
jgi:hypothetical protein